MIGNLEGEDGLSPGGTVPWESNMFTTLKNAGLATLMVVGAPAMAQMMSAESYVMKAGASDLYEKTSSQLVLATTGNAEVKRFANMMVSDHSSSTAKVKAAAMKSGLKPKPPMLEPKQQAMITALRNASSGARDALYITQQKAAHQEALALHQDYSKAGTAAPLKMAAGEIAPVVQHHIEMLASMK